MVKRYRKTDNELIAHIKQDDAWAMNQLYLKYKRTITLYIRGRGATADQGLECYHDTILNVERLIKSGMLDENEGTIEPFLKKAAWFQWQKMLRSERRERARAQENEVVAVDTSDRGKLEEMIAEETRTKKLQRLKTAFSELSPRCKAILELGFFANPPYSAQEIAELLQLANANVARVTKANCLKSLKSAYFRKT